MGKKEDSELLLELERERHARETLKLERKLRAVRAELSDIKTANKGLAKLAEQQEKELDATALALRPHGRLRRIRPRLRKSASESTAVACISDWHMEEIVDKRTVGGKNAYNPEVAKKRAENYFQRLMKQIDVLREHTEITDLVLWLGGDLITGHIHEENVHYTAMPPMQAVRFAGEVLIRGMEFLLEHGKFERIIVPTCFGNHGRNQKQKYFSVAAEHNHEWYLYLDLEKHFRNEDRLEFRVSRDKIHDEVVVYGRRLRFHHGDDCRYQGGQQGIYGRLHVYHKAQNQTTPCDFTVIGHYHQLLLFNRLGGINGSLIGYQPYGRNNSFPFEPPAQLLFLIEKNLGMTHGGPIFVE